MTYQHFIMIRFSIKMKRRTGFYSPIKNWDDNRMKNRFFLFEYICLPSLLNQKLKKNLKIIIMISSDLPKKYKKRLHDITKEYDFIKIVKVDNLKWGNGDFLKKFCPPNTEFIVTTRLDDDDALNPYFTKLVAKFIKDKNKDKKLDDYIISYPFGYYLNLDRTNKKIGYMINSGRLIACGLTRVRKFNKRGTAYCGNHKRLDKKGFKIFYDNRPGMYSATNHDFNDSKRSFRMINLKNNKDLDREYLKFFSFIDPKKLLHDSI